MIQHQEPVKSTVANRLPTTGRRPGEASRPAGEVLPRQHSGDD